MLRRTTAEMRRMYAWITLRDICFDTDHELSHQDGLNQIQRNECYGNFFQCKFHFTGNLERLSWSRDALLNYPIAMIASFVRRTRTGEGEGRNRFDTG